jgi:hypothetical protein
MTKSHHYFLHLKGELYGPKRDEVSVKVNKHQNIYMCGEVEVQLHSFFTSALDGGECQVHTLPTLFPGTETWYLLDRRLGGPQNWSGFHS